MTSRWKTAVAAAGAAASRRWRVIALSSGTTGPAGATVPPDSTVPGEDGGRHGDALDHRHRPRDRDRGRRTSPPSTPASRRRAPTAAEALDTVGHQLAGPRRHPDRPRHRRGGHPDVGSQPVPELRRRRAGDHRLPGVDERHASRSATSTPSATVIDGLAGLRRRGADARRHLVRLRRSRGGARRRPHRGDRERPRPRRAVRRGRRHRRRRDRAHRRGLDARGVPVRRRLRRRRGRRAASVAIEPGTQDLAADVTVVFEMS